MFGVSHAKSSARHSKDLDELHCAVSRAKLSSLICRLSWGGSSLNPETSKPYSEVYGDLVSRVRIRITRVTIWVIIHSRTYQVPLSLEVDLLHPKPACP